MKIWDFIFLICFFRCLKDFIIWFVDKIMDLLPIAFNNNDDNGNKNKR